MNIRITLIIILACVMGMLFPAQVQASEIISLKTRPGVTQTFILIKTDHPVASVILFAGGHGNLKLSSVSGIPSIGWGKNNFLVRTRNKFAEYGFMMAVVDAPFDKKGKKRHARGLQK